MHAVLAVLATNGCVKSHSQYNGGRRERKPTGPTRVGAPQP